MLAVWGYVMCMHACKVRPRGWSYRWFWVAPCELRSSGRTVSVFKHWATSPVQFDSVSLCNSGSPVFCYVDQVDCKLRHSPASPSQVLGLKTCTTISSLYQMIYLFIFAAPLQLSLTPLLSVPPLYQMIFKTIFSYLNDRPTAVLLNGCLS